MHLKDSISLIISLIFDIYRDTTAQHCVTFSSLQSEGTVTRESIPAFTTEDFCECIRLSGKCLSFTDASFTTTYLYTNVKPKLSNVVIFSLIEQNGSYVIR